MNDLKPNITREQSNEQKIFDFVIVGSGFGGSVSAMRLAEKGYSVLVLERGKRFQDQDFPKTNWNPWKYLWLPSLRSYGPFQMSLFNGLFVFHGSAVGGGSQVYAAVLMEPDEDFYSDPIWAHLADWKTVLTPFYQSARQMLGVTPNPRMELSDIALQDIADEIGLPEGFRSTEVGIFFGEDGETVPDPFFSGNGPDRTGCIFCGGCMVGCRYNAKNTLEKNYLYFAEKYGAEILPEAVVTRIDVLDGSQKTDARYRVTLRSLKAIFRKPDQSIFARNVVVSAGVLGTLDLLLMCRDVHRTLPRLSSRLGTTVRTNSEAFLGAFRWVKMDEQDHSQGVAISSILRADHETQIEPVRFSKGSSLIFWLLGGPLFQPEGGLVLRALKLIARFLARPMEFISLKLKPGLSERGTALMIMQMKNNLMRIRLGSRLLNKRRYKLVCEHDEKLRIPVNIELGQKVAASYSGKLHAKVMGSLLESILRVPTTAHMLGGCLIGENEDEGVISKSFEVFNYPGLYVIDGSVVPANPGINPSLTITALAEYAMSLIPQKQDASRG